MKTSDTGRKFIEQWEGRFTHTYDDGVGVLTIGYGHTTAAGPPAVTRGMVITEADCDKILADDLGRVEKDIYRLVTVPLSQNQYDVLSSFQFNTGGLAKSTLLKKLNAGDYAAVPDELKKWDRAGGKTMMGLTRRRAAEARVWSLATQATSPEPLPPDVPLPPTPTLPPNAPRSIIQIILDILSAIFGGRK